MPGIEHSWRIETRLQYHLIRPVTNICYSLHCTELPVLTPDWVHLIIAKLLRAHQLSAIKPRTMFRSRNTLAVRGALTIRQQMANCGHILIPTACSHVKSVNRQGTQRMFASAAEALAGDEGQDAHYPNQNSSSLTRLSSLDDKRHPVNKFKRHRDDSHKLLIFAFARAVQSHSSMAARPVILTRCLRHGKPTQIQSTFLGEHIFVTWRIVQDPHLKPSTFLQA